MGYDGVELGKGFSDPRGQSAATGANVQRMNERKALDAWKAGHPRHRRQLINRDGVYDEGPAARDPGDPLRERRAEIRRMVVDRIL